MPSIERLRNLIEYVQDFGIDGTISLLASRLTHGREYSIKVKGFGRLQLRRDSSDFLTLRQVVRGGAFNAVRLKNPQYIIDGGANVGFVSVALARRFRDAVVCAVEPDPQNFVQLSKNTRSLPNVQPLLAAVWKRDSRLSISNPSAGDWEYQVREDPEGQILGVSIDSILDRAGVDVADLIKLDIEGAEWDLFETPPAWLARVKVLMLELHERLRPGCSDRVIGTLNRLSPQHTRLDEYDVFEIPVATSHSSVP